MTTQTITLTPMPVKPGDILTELLVTDTVCYQVIRVTDKSIVISRMSDAPVPVISISRDGNPYPICYTAQIKPATPTYVRRLMLRKDGTYRLHNSGHALRIAPTCEFADGNTYSYRVTDYRY
jgi:hypothetical protein